MSGKQNGEIDRSCVLELGLPSVVVENRQEAKPLTPSRERPRSQKEKKRSYQLVAASC